MSEAKRLQKLERLERLYKQMHELEVWRLETLKRERDALAESHRAMFAALGEGIAAYGAPAAAAMRRILAIEREIVETETEVAEQKRKAFDQGARAKLADRARETVDQRYRDQQRRKELAELIERSLNNPKSSSA
jgi:acetyl-CoA carboxylase carboxyltransferase component